MRPVVPVAHDGVPPRMRTEEATMAGLPRALAPLQQRDYRRLAGSLGLSLFSTGLWTVAVVWQVVALGGGPAQLSLVTGLQAGGMLASTLAGGVLADRVPQRHILLGVAVTQALGIALVAVLSTAGLLALGALAAVSLVVGLAMGLYYPAYSALVPALVAERELLAVNGLEGVVRPVLAQAAGPAVAVCSWRRSPPERRWPPPRWPRWVRPPAWP